MIHCISLKVTAISAYFGRMITFSKNTNSFTTQQIKAAKFLTTKIN